MDTATGVMVTVTATAIQANTEASILKSPKRKRKKNKKCAFGDETEGAFYLTNKLLFLFSKLAVAPVGRLDRIGKCGTHRSVFENIYTLYRTARGTAH